MGWRNKKKYKNIYKRGFKKKLAETHSNQSVSDCERTLLGCWTALDDGGDENTAL